METSATSTEKPLKILLIDDDEFFGRVMQTKAASNGMTLEHFSSLEKLGRVSFFANYDVVLLDYWGMSLNGRELAEYVTAFCPNMPAVIISSDNQLLNNDMKWPDGVLARISKDTGPTNILKETSNLVRSLH